MPLYEVRIPIRGYAIVVLAADDETEAEIKARQEIRTNTEDELAERVVVTERVCGKAQIVEQRYD